MDRFEQGLPDPQEADVIEYCANETCGNEIYQGEKAVTYGDALCCSFKCVAVIMGAYEITAGE
ncbi:hypothetical protein BK126_03170 [Paenibacillus sp. FSL H7-0326]|uniref:hypothetical protein n=1 Tax=Paenibacillus sp. FSL H7-0326 TaxID=1921144 RepID=UPI00096E9A67|nr:hypothetical protein [Paenibacillus sp. FSL H7-0326]OMC71129.1 hypothetical protein BK126_03170 [Paenibacillus sp. FSL H7-0326]